MKIKCTSNGNANRSKASINKDIIARFNEVIMGFCFPPFVAKDTTVEDVREAAVKVLERMTHNGVIKLAAYFKERYRHWGSYADVSTPEKAKQFCYEVIHRLASYSCDLGDSYYRNPKRVGTKVGNLVEIKEFYIQDKGGDELNFYFSRTV